MKRIIWLLTITALAAGSVAVLAEAQERVVRRMPQDDLRLEAASDRSELAMRTFGGRPVVEVMIDGNGPYDFVLDTGAGGTVLSSELAEELGLETTGSMRVRDPVHEDGVEAPIVAVPTLAFGDFTIHGMESPTISEKRMPKGENAPRGVLSLNSMPGLMATFDYEGERMIFEKGELPEADGQEILEYKAPMGVPELPIMIGGHEFSAHLDTGSGRGLMLPMEHAESLGLEGKLKEIGKGRLVGGEITIFEAPFKGDVKIGKHVISDPSIRFAEGMPHVNVGGAILSQYVLTIDPANHRLRLVEQGSMTAKQE